MLFHNCSTSGSCPLACPMIKHRTFCRHIPCPHSCSMCNSGRTHTHKVQHTNHPMQALATGRHHPRCPLWRCSRPRQAPQHHTRHCHPPPVLTTCTGSTAVPAALSPHCRGHAPGRHATRMHYVGSLSLLRAQPTPAPQHLGSDAQQQEDALQHLLHTLGDIDTGVAHAAQQAILRTASTPQGQAAVMEAAAGRALTALTGSENSLLRLRGLALLAALLVQHPGTRRRCIPLGQRVHCCSFAPADLKPQGWWWTRTMRCCTRCFCR